MKTLPSREYYTEVALLRKRVRRAKAMFYFLLMMAPFVPILTPAFFIELIEDQLDGFEVALYGYFLFNATVFATITATAIWQMMGFRRDLRRGVYRKLADNDMPPLHSICSDLAERMDLDFRRVSLWLDRRGRSSLTPSIEQDRAGCKLIIPMALACHAHEDPKPFAAMVAHEYAHVLHADASLWRIAQALAGSVRRFVPGIVIATVAYVMLQSIRGNLQSSLSSMMFLICLAPTLLFMKLSGEVMVIRRRSEILADHVACFFAGAESLQRAITECTVGAIERDETEDHSYFHFKRGLHPSKYVRLHAIGIFPGLPPAETMPTLPIPVFSLALVGLFLLFTRGADVKDRLFPSSAYKQGVNDGAQLAYQETLVTLYVGHWTSVYSLHELSDTAKHVLRCKWDALPERDARDYSRGFRRGWNMGAEEAFREFRGKHTQFLSDVSIRFKSGNSIRYGSGWRPCGVTRMRWSSNGRLRSAFMYAASATSGSTSNMRSIAQAG